MYQAVYVNHENIYNFPILTQTQTLQHFSFKQKEEKKRNHIWRDMVLSGRGYIGVFLTVCGYTRLIYENIWTYRCYTDSPVWIWESRSIEHTTNGRSIVKSTYRKY